MQKLKVVFLSFILFGPAAFAQSTESKIQAIFVLKFIENVNWPDDRKNIVLGVVGKSEVFAELEGRLRVKNPNGIVVKNISASSADECDAVYVPSSEDSAMSAVNNSVKGKAILVITQSDFSRKSSCISFKEDDGRLHFIINKNMIESRGLKVSGALLILGKQV